MDIHEAAAQAVSTGRFIRRTGEFWAMLKIKPTDTPDCCIVICEDKKQAPGPRWHPQGEDLLAEDWMVVD